MLRRQTRNTSTTSESSEDDKSHTKKQMRMLVSSIQVRKFSKKQSNSSGRNSSANKIKYPSNSFVPYLTRLRTRGTPSNNDNIGQSSTSETDDLVQPTYRKSIRASSDYASETRSDEGNDTNSEIILNTLSLQSNSVTSNAALEYSSDNSNIIQTKSLKRRKTSVINLSSSSESSDSEVAGLIVRASGKRTRLCSSSDSSSSTSSSSDNSNENNIISRESSFENEITSNLSSDFYENGIQLPREENRRIQRSANMIPNLVPTETQSRLTSSRQNCIVNSSEDNIPRSNRQTNRSTESGSSPNTIHLRRRIRRRRRMSASTSALNQNPVQNAVRQNRRLGETLSQNITGTFPTHRQNARLLIDNRMSLPNVSRPNIPHGRRHNAEQDDNTRTVVNRQAHVRQSVTSARQNRRTSGNREAVGRTSTNSTSATTHRRNITYNEPTVISDLGTGFNLRISMQNGQDVTFVTDFDTDSSSGSSSDYMRPVLRRRRAILSSDNNTSSDSEASSIIVNRARRSIKMVISDNDTEEDTQKKTVKTSGKIPKVIVSDLDGETEKCPICFGIFEQQEVATPKACKHCFCLECIKKWAENSNTCPVDRRTFHSIIVRSNVQGEVVREEVVPPPNNVANESSDVLFIGNLSDFTDANSDYSDLVLFGSDSDLNVEIQDYDGSDEICALCMLRNDDEELISCDSCNNVYHMQCVDPPLQYIPTYWACPECVEAE